MLKTLLRWIERAFAPTMDLIGHLPPRAMNRMFTPF